MPMTASYLRDLAAKFEAASLQRLSGNFPDAYLMTPDIHEAILAKSAVLEVVSIEPDFRTLFGIPFEVLPTHLEVMHRAFDLQAEGKKVTVLSSGTRNNTGNQS